MKTFNGIFCGFWQKSPITQNELKVWKIKILIQNPHIYTFLSANINYKSKYVDVSQ